MNKAFSLLELSIVLVIIGLIAGGIVAGSSMIRAAELRAITTEYSQYQTAVMTFRDKYLGLPGDLKNATAFWGAADGGDGIGNDCGQIESTGTETCNGNGDGELEDINDNGFTIIENLRFWQHLANAGLISGTFSGSDGTTAPYHAVIGENVPTSKASGAGWSVEHPCFGTNAVCTNLDLDWGNVWYVGAQHSSYYSTIGFFTAEEIWNLDKKMDDGMPNSGRLWRGDASCAESSDLEDPSINYDLDDTSSLCHIKFVKAF